MFDCDAYDIFLAARGSQLTTHGIQRSNPALAMSGHTCLVMGARCHTADQEGDQQHHQESHQVLAIRNGKTKSGRNKKEIERQHTQE